MGIRLDRAEDALTLTATDSTAWASYRISSAVCAQPGSVIVQASLLAAVAKTTGKVGISAKAVPFGHVTDQVVFVTDAGTTTLRQYPDDDWPTAPRTPADEQESWVAWSVDPAHIRAVLPAASHEDSRPLLTCVAFQPGVMVATDSYRLHAIDGGLPDWPELFVPAIALRWVAKEQEPVWLCATEDGKVIRISGGAQTWVTRAVDAGTAWSEDKKARVPAKYPAWRSLIPTNQTSHLTIDRAEILRAVRHCLSIVPGTVDPIKLEAKHGGIRFVRTISDVCTLEASTVGKLDGPEITVAFNGSYLRDCVAAGSGDSVTIHMSDPIRPGTITDDGPAVRLLMPVRIA
jgi:DNA polymerase-3 subunit beta